MSFTMYHHIRGCEYFGRCLYVCSAESAKSRWHDSVAVGGDADMKLGKCVVWTKMEVEFKDGCGTNTRSVLGASWVV